MSDAASLASIFASAEQAAMAGDFAGAARLLGEAARAQEALLGPDHLDLANTLNNLAIAHERSGQLDAAEREYRRAHAIAARRLPPDDPNVITSAQNLRDFCAAHGRPLTPAPPLAAAEPPAPAPRRERLAITYAPDPPPTAPAARAEAPRAASRPIPATEPRLVAAAEPAAVAAPPRPAAPRAAVPAAPPRPTTGARGGAPAGPAAETPARRSWLPLLLALGAIAILVIWLLSGRGPATPQATTPEGSPPLTPPSVPAPPGQPGDPPPASTAPGAAPAGAAAARPAAPPAPAAEAATSDGPTIDDARLCTSLGPGYHCDPAASPIRPGPLTFYTRVVATRGTSIVHRWYRGDELRQSVRLDIPARRNGFRTYSRATVSRGDDWRVEARARDGRILHSQAFSVR